MTHNPLHFDKRIVDDIGNYLARFDTWSDYIAAADLANSLLPRHPDAAAIIADCLEWMRAKGMVCPRCVNVHRKKLGYQLWPTQGDPE